MKVRFPEELYATFRKIKDQEQEILIGVYLDDDLEIKAYDILGMGGENGVLVSLRDVFGRGLMIKSYTFILLHNHPSGKSEPSPADEQVMKTVREQAAVMNMKFLDFIIIGDLGSPEIKNYWSMFEKELGGEYGLG